MTIHPEVLDAMIAAGADRGMIVAVIKADAAAEQAAQAARRQGNRDRQASKRRRDHASPVDGHDAVHPADDLRDVTVDAHMRDTCGVTSVTRDSCDVLSLSPSPQTPQPHTHTQVDTTTRAREADDWPPGGASSHAAALARGNRRIDMARDPGLTSSICEIARWREQGFSFTNDVMPTIAASARRKAGSPIRVWGYFNEAIAQAHRARTRPVDPVVMEDQHGHSDASVDKFRRRQLNLVVAATVRPAQRGGFNG